MGVLRFLLAFCVVTAHAGPLAGIKLGDGRLAVQIFYMVSGFYMSMVWTEKYSQIPSPVKTFYQSRALRIYPLYFLVLAVSLLIVIYLKFPLQYTLNNPPSFETAIWVYLTQITLIGMETPIFFGLDGYWISPVAWTLGLEITFYLLVPVLMERPRLMVFLVFSSLLGRYVAYETMEWSEHSKSYESVWSYRFFPFEIALFLAGSIAQQMFSNKPRRFITLLDNSMLYATLFAFVVATLVFFPKLKNYMGESAYWLYYLIVFVTISQLFQCTKKNEYDFQVGELSYPMYLLHIPILWVVASFSEPANYIYWVLPATVFFSIAASKLQRIFDNYRHGFYEMQKIQIN